MIAMAVASAMEKEDRDQMIEDVLSVEEYAMSLGASTVSPSLGTRIRYGIELAKHYAKDEDRFLDELYTGSYRCIGRNSGIGRNICTYNNAWNYKPNRTGYTYGKAYYAV